MLALQRSKDLKVLYNQQRGEHAVTTAPATTSPELPLGKSVHQDQMPLRAAGNNVVQNAGPTNSPQEWVRENAQHLVDAVVAKKPKSDRAIDAAFFEQTEISDSPDVETNMKYVQEGHVRY
ncbi:hypothetical protein N7519_007963 [Penicillium mononematosum]|uniref:uncharacterized protein n=1 Tax=Penicillium mononematosum TaxID=268346 RepID=UPI002546D486|nr:uncharacterized protein N7519_007963 [Penicillium mononematosum]KAJ6186662.1 hypothetical protein N7519_007963 [Penicillium mononematosum]